MTSMEKMNTKNRVESVANSRETVLLTIDSLLNTYESRLHFKDFFSTTKPQSHV
jgi:hypothetical protein